MAPSIPPALRDWGTHPFCFLDWHISNTLTAYFADAPTPSSLQDRHESTSISKEALLAAIKAMQPSGWQMIQQEPNQEGCIYTLMRVPPPDAGHEYVVMTTLITPQTGAKRLKGVFRLGKKNEYFFLKKSAPLDPLDLRLPETEAYLIAQGWEREQVRSYPYYGQQGSTHEVHLLRRKQRKLWWR